MRLAVLLAAALPLLACAPAVPEPEVPASNWILPGSAWRLVELNGAPFEAEVTARLTPDGRILGEAPCNSFSAPYTGKWPQLTFDPVVTTRRTCPEQAEETAFLTALAQVERSDNTEEGVILTGPGGVTLRFEPAS